MVSLIWVGVKNGAVVGSGGRVRRTLRVLLSEKWGGSRDVLEKCEFRMFACCCGEGELLLGVVIVSCVLGASVYLLLSCRMSFQSLDGLVLNVMLERRVFHCVFCSCWMSSVISWLRFLMRVVFSGVGGCRLRWFRVCIFSLMVLVKPGLYCLTAPVGMCCLLLLTIAVLKCLITVLMLAPVGVGVFGWDRACSTLFVKAGQFARL